MKKGIYVVVACCVAFFVAGCVKTVTDEKAGGMPGFRDRVEGRYERPLNEVFEASKRSLASFGNVTREGTLLTSSNQVRTIEGFVNQNGVWMRVESVSPTVTSVIVQVRTKWGGTDMQTAHDLEKGIALQLAR